MNYPEFKHLKVINDSNNPFVVLFEYPDGSRFYLEPAFYTQMQAFKEAYESDYPKILNRMEEVVKKNKRVIFTSSIENPQVIEEGYIYHEITDITNPLNLIIDYKIDPDTGWTD